jgi:GAF domain-containing protein
MRGQVRPRDSIGVLNIESDELLTPRFCDVMIGFSNAAGFPLRAAVRMGDINRFARRITAPVSRASLAAALLDATLAHLPGRERRGLVALRSTRARDRCVVEAMTTAGLPEARIERYRSGRLDLATTGGAWGEAIRTGEPIYVPDLSRATHVVHHPLWEDTQSLLVVPLKAGYDGEVLGLLGLESPETSYAFSTQDRGFFEIQAALASVAAASVEEARLEYADAVQVPALLERLRKKSLAEISEDQIVRINVICRALVKHGFVFQPAADESRLTVHILREYTSRSPRIIDVEALRALAARRQEGRHPGIRPRAAES